MNENTERIQSFIRDWKEQWIAEQNKESQHSLEFWEEIADMLVEGRLPLRNNPLVPIGEYGFDWPDAMRLLVTRNNLGVEYEKRGETDAAIGVYELSIADVFFGTHPYDRLRIIYEKRGWYKDAARVCRAYLGLPNRANGQNKLHFTRHLKKLEAQMLKKGQSVEEEQ